MSELLDELVAHGFEIVKDDSGQHLVKLVFMDENDEATGYALVAPEDAKKIISGQATLQNVLDEDGKQVLTLASVEPDVSSLSENKNKEASSVEAITRTNESSEGLSKQNTDETLSLPMSNVSIENGLPSKDVPAVFDEGGSARMNEGEAVEQYLLSEQTAMVDNKTTQVVTLMDAQGQILDQKHGNTGEQVVLEMHGQMFSYELQGPSVDGEPITSTLLVSSAEADSEAGAQSTAAVTEDLSASGDWAQTTPATETTQATDPTSLGQQYTLTEASTLQDGETLQTVILTDENGNVLDQKQGRTGEHVIIEMSGNSLEYVFLGPTENGEPITTTLVVTTDMDANDVNGHAVPATSVGSEMLNTVSEWCPAGLPAEFYTIVCRQVESIAATRIPRTADGTPFYRTEPYHKKLGPLPVYHQMATLAETYRPGANNGETLERYEELRNFAKIYRPSGPQSRALTKYEIAMNEAAAQLCRFHPGLLFHKRELFHLAKETVEQSQLILNTERRLFQQGQESIEQSRHPGPTNTNAPLRPPISANRTQPPRSLVPQTVPQPSPATAAVGGRVASSQLALLESRGLSGIKPQTTPTNANIPAFQTPSAGDVHTEQTPTISSQSGTTGRSSPLAAKPQPTGTDSSMNFYPSMPLMKRDTICKLSATQDEAIRAAALDIIIDLPRYELKSKMDCTNIELACWDQAKQLATQTHLPLDSTVTDGTAGLHTAISALISNEQRVSSVREAAAIYGRTPGAASLNSTPTGLSRSPSITALIPYEVACNEAAAYLASAVPQLLTHRRELAELAKKVVRNSGCLFTNSSAVDKMAVGGGVYRFYCSDQLPELDFSAADQLLSDPLDRSDSPDSGCSVGAGDTETENVASGLQTLSLSCEECNNIITDVVIYSSTGTDSLKKVRILSLSDCGFTGMIPMHLNQCSNLIELNLSDNALFAFPRCLHLPKLKRLNLRNNPRLCNPNPSTGVVEPPLVEQFPRLVSLELDVPLVKLLCRQSLACLCPYLKTINGEDFSEEPTEETIKAIQSAKHQLSTLIYSKWEDDIAGFYKKGLPKRDTIRVIETLVLHAVKRSMDIGTPFVHCKSILARRVAEDFLSPKMLDEDVDDEAAEYLQRITELSDEEELQDSESDADLDDAETADGLEVVKSKKETKKLNTESTEASVAEREAEAAAANLALLPDEPPDRLINVVGQALRHGKTVVYAVIRTAARQPDGELIPVGGGLGITSSTNAALTATLPSTSETASELNNTVIHTQYEDEIVDEEPSSELTSESTQMSYVASPPLYKPGPKSVKLAQQRKQLARKQTQPRDVSANDVSVSSAYARRPGLMARPSVDSKGKNTPKILPRTPSKPLPKPMPLPKPPRLSAPKPRTPVPKTKSPTQSPPVKTVASTGPVYTVQQRRVLPSDYIIRPSQSESQPAYVVPNILAQTKLAAAAGGGDGSDVAALAPTSSPMLVRTPTATARTPTSNRKPVSAHLIPTSSTSATLVTPTRTPGRRGRPPGPQSVAKKLAAAELAAKEMNALLKNVPIPPPHSPPPPTMRMSTRDTNRLKRFSVYGVIDTGAALAGKEEALLAAALAAEAEQESETARQIMESAVVLSEEDTAVAEAAVSKVTDKEPAVDVDTGGWTVTEPSRDSLHKQALPLIVRDEGKRRSRRSVTATPTRDETEDKAIGSSPSGVTPGRKRASRTLSPRQSVEPKRASVVASNDEDLEKSTEVSKKHARSLTELGSVVDYDPLHFIRCHARDNDPTDCETKVWRCAFEPSVDDPANETSNVVATCGGECVCLIDCKSGRVMKRFKHLGEEFYSLAWTTVEMAAGRKTNLLAAAGKLREIRLLHPEQLVCYAEMRGHKDDVACMIFHPDKPTILFSGDSKANVLVWDIGIPSAPEYRTRHQLLMRLVCLRPSLNPVLNLVFLPKFDALLAGCEDGVFMWNFQEFRREKTNEEREPDTELKIPTRREPCFDGLARLTENLVVVKCVEEGEIYVFDLGQVIQKIKRLPSSKKVVTVEIRGQLRWQTTEEIYINVTARSGLHAVICGDNEGTIWLYDLQKQVDEDARRFKTKPVKILEWPECSIGGAKEEDTQMKECITSGFKNPVVNSTDISHDGQYLAAVTDNNLVCIWKFSG